MFYKPYFTPKIPSKNNAKALLHVHPSWLTYFTPLTWAIEPGEEDIVNFMGVFVFLGSVPPNLGRENLHQQPSLVLIAFFNLREK
jgi:hypothetical protein